MHTNKEYSDGFTNSFVWWVRRPLLCFLSSPLFSVTVAFFFSCISSLIHTNELRNNLHRKCTVNLFLGYSITAVVMKNSVSWDMAPCRPFRFNQRFERTCRLKHQDIIISKARNCQSLLPTSCYFLVWILFLPKDGGDMFPDTSIDFQQITGCYIPEDRTVYY